jgi:II/X family phage/plasmid replication protein
MLQRLAIPTNVWDFENHSINFDGCLIKELWKQSWSEIFKTFEGETMRTYSDSEIHDKLREKFKTETKSGFSFSKADRLFRFLRMIKHEGWEEVKATTPKATFHRSIKDITQVVSKAYLQNLQATASNVVPLIRVINVDFERQHPAGWSEPKPLSEQFENGLRLVS